MSPRGGRGFVRDSLAFALSQYVSRAMLLARGLVAAAAMGPAGFGAWNALGLILDYGSYAPLGSLYGLDLTLPPAIARGESELALRSLRAAWGVTLAGFAVFALAVIAYLAAGTWLVSTGWGWGPPLLMLAAALLQLAFQYHATTLRARGDFAAVGTAVTLQAVIGGGLGLLAVWRAGVWGLLWGWLAGTVVALARLRISPHRPPLAPGPPLGGIPLVRRGAPLFAFFVLTLALRSADRIALARFGGNAALGHYSIGLIAAGLVLYLPEAAAAVLFPRIAAAAAGAADAEALFADVRRAQRAIAVLLPLPVGLGLLWAGPVIARLLPQFGEGLPALRRLAIGALLLAGATLPGYVLLGSGRGRRLLLPAAVMTLLAGILVFSTAARAPTPAPVALAAALGQGLFAAVMTTLGARVIASDARSRRWIVISTLAPALWGGALALALTSGEPTGVGLALRTGGFVLGYAPALALFGRGLGLRGMVGEWLLPV